MHLQQRFAKPGGIVSSAIAPLGQADAELLRQHLHRFREIDFLVQLEKLEHVAAGAAAEAVKKSFLRIDVKRRRLLRMKRTQPLVGRPRTLQRNIVLDDLDDVGMKPEIVDELLGEEGHTELVKFTIDNSQFTKRHVANWPL